MSTPTCPTIDKEENDVDNDMNDDTRSTTTSSKSYLLREPNQAMNPTAILSGYYGPRGERLKYTVHEGALRLPAAALTMTNYMDTAQIQQHYRLPAVDAVLRPSQTDKTMTVTELLLETDPTTGFTSTVATNRSFWNVGVKEEQRIRGGNGNSEDNGDNEGVAVGVAINMVPPTQIEAKVEPVDPISTTTTVPPPVISATIASVPSSATIEAFAPPVSIPSSSGITSNSTVTPLNNKPTTQWEQNFIPGPNDEMQTEIKTPPPPWYNPTSISDLERTMLPEWFDASAPHRTPETYRGARERIRTMSTKIGNRYITQTLVRRTIAGDAGSLHRLHAFLVAWSIINEDAINDSTPTAAGMREELMKKRPFAWNDRWRDELTEAVVEESNKRHKTIDWEGVAAKVGHGAKAHDCEIEFLVLPLEARAASQQAERSITPDVTSNGSSTKVTIDTNTFVTTAPWVERLLTGMNPKVVEAATAAALEVSQGDLLDAQRGTIAALVMTKATERAQVEEAGLSRALLELQEQRLQKLENRFALMDDIECILEAERVSLELERRDLYTARCRHWFSGGN